MEILNGFGELVKTYGLGIVLLGAAGVWFWRKGWPFVEKVFNTFLDQLSEARAARERSEAAFLIQLDKRDAIAEYNSKRTGEAIDKQTETLRGLTAVVAQFKCNEPGAKN